MYLTLGPSVTDCANHEGEGPMYWWRNFELSSIWSPYEVSIPTSPHKGCWDICLGAALMTQYTVHVFFFICFSCWRVHSVNVGVTCIVYCWCAAELVEHICSLPRAIAAGTISRSDWSCCSCYHILTMIQMVCSCVTLKRGSWMSYNGVQPIAFVSRC